MPEFKRDKLEKILKELSDVGGILGSAIVTRDGLLVVSDLCKKGCDINDETFAAMSATMFGAAETALVEMKKKKAEEVTVESDDAKLIALSAGDKALLVTITEPDVNLGLVRIEMGKASEKIQKEI